MKISQFLQESNGQFSSSRLFAFLVTIATIADWMHAVFIGGGVWKPEWQTISMVLGVLGFKVAQKYKEEKVNNKQEKETEKKKEKVKK